MAVASAAAVVVASAVAGVVASVEAGVVASVEVVAVASAVAEVVALVEAGVVASVVAVVAEEELLLVSFQLTKDPLQLMQARKPPSEEMSFLCLRGDLLWV